MDIPTDSLIRTGKVTKVVDGDTFDIAFTSTIRIRITDVDTEEMRDKDVHSKKRAELAKKVMTDHLLNNDVQVKIPLQNDIQYSLTLNRVLGEIVKPKNVVFNLIYANGLNKFSKTEGWYEEIDKKFIELQDELGTLPTPTEIDDYTFYWHNVGYCFKTNHFFMMYHDGEFNTETTLSNEEFLKFINQKYPLFDCEAIC